MLDSLLLDSNVSISASSFRLVPLDLVLVIIKQGHPVASACLKCKRTRTAHAPWAHLSAFNTPGLSATNKEYQGARPSARHLALGVTTTSQSAGGANPPSVSHDGISSIRSVHALCRGLPHTRGRPTLIDTTSVEWSQTSTALFPGGRTSRALG